MYEESCPYLAIIIPFSIEKFNILVSTTVVPAYLMYSHYNWHILLI